MSNSGSPAFSRPQAAERVRRLAEPRRFLQVMAGARQVGKTTLVGQVAEQAGLPSRYASADQPTLRAEGPAVVLGGQVYGAPTVHHDLAHRWFKQHRAEGWGACRSRLLE